MILPLLLKPRLVVVTCAALVALELAVASCGRREAPAPGQASESPPAPLAGPSIPPEALRVARRVVSAADRKNYLGSQACTACHPAAAVQRHTRHARTLARVDPKVEQPRFTTPPGLEDPLFGTSYEVAVRGGQCWLRAETDFGDREARADYAFGEGNVGVTYVSRPANVSTQLRITWYPQYGWEWTPGLRPGKMEIGPLGEVLGEKSETECFSCHATVLARGKDGLDLNRSLLGIGCETCHGPGRAHVAAVRRGARNLRMVRLALHPEAVARHLCAHCHRAPGDVDLGNPSLATQLPRFQNAALDRSRCAREGHLTCTNCHDPHRNADDTSRDTYNGVCRSCHAAPGPSPRRSCPVQPRGDCVSCHMPLQRIGLPNGHEFRNHWIKVWKTPPS